MQVRTNLPNHLQPRISLSGFLEHTLHMGTPLMACSAIDSQNEQIVTVILVADQAYLGNNIVDNSPSTAIDRTLRPRASICGSATKATGSEATQQSRALESRR